MKNKLSFKSQIVSIILVVFFITDTHGQKSLGDSSKVFLEYSIIDLPFQMYAGKTVNLTIANPNAAILLFKGRQYQSMEQSTQILNNFFTASNWGVKQIPVFRKRPFLQKVTHATISSLLNNQSYKLYDFAAWQHEEFHRSVMVTNHTNSYNPFGLFNKREESFSGAVAYVLDTNLVMMKDKNLPSFIRMHTAGGEGQIFSVESLQKQNFFNDQKLFLSAYYFTQISELSNYILLTSQKEISTGFTEDLMKLEGNRQELRDFTGLDYSAWAYDLWRPNEPYSGRGLNPYGNGYDRYIKGTDLTDEQLNWLKKQDKLSQLNIISPMNFFISSIKIKKLKDGSYLKGNFSVRYYPTSFGNQLGIDLLMKYKKWNLYANPHLNQNLNHSFPGLELGLVDLPVNYQNKKYLISLNTTTSIQPKSDGFLINEKYFVGSFRGTVKRNFSERLFTSVSLNAKTKGWIKGNPFMRSNIGLSMSMGFLLQKN